MPLSAWNFLVRHPIRGGKGGSTGRIEEVGLLVKVGGQILVVSMDFREFGGGHRCDFG